MSENVLSKGGISISRLETLSKVIEKGGVSAAAEGDPSTQSLYSRQLSELEGAIEKELFVRDGRGKKPTSLGKQLASVYETFSFAVSELVSASSRDCSIIRIGAGDSVYQWILLPAIRRLEGAFPSLSFEFKNLRTDDVLSEIRAGGIDIGIAETRKVEKGVQSNELRRLEFGLYYPEEYGNGVTIQQCLSKGKLIGLNGTGSYVKNCRRQQKKAKVPESFWLTFDSLPMVANSMIQSRAAAFLPLEMEDELKERGFECISGSELSEFSRRYSILVNEYSRKIRESVVLVHQAMIEDLA